MRRYATVVGLLLIVGGALLPLGSAVDKLEAPHYPWYVCPEIYWKPPYITIFQSTSCYDGVTQAAVVAVLP